MCLQIELRFEIGFDLIVERGRVPHSLKKAEASPAHEQPECHSITTFTRRGGGGNWKVHVGSHDKGYIVNKMSIFVHSRGVGVKIG